MTAMPTLPSRFLAIGAAMAMLAVILGAFGAHALRTLVSPERLGIFHTGVEYQFTAAIGLMIIGLFGRQRSGRNDDFDDIARGTRTSRPVAWAGWLMVSGMALFSGSLYVIALTGIRAAGMITPLGGVAFIAAWALLAWAAWRDGKSD